MGALAGLHLYSDLSHRPLVTVGLLGLSWLGLAVSIRWGSRIRSYRLILGLALLGRLLMVPLAPDLSQDVWRYLWDGRVAAAGFDPYRIPPDDPQLRGLRELEGGDLWERLHHRAVPTVYPPLALTAQSVVARLPGSLWWWKVLLMGIDLLACWLLLRLADARGLSRTRTLWYILHPLVLFEVSGMGHIDILGVAACLLAVYWLVVPTPRVKASAVAASAACLAKLVPIVAWPLWARTSSRPALYLAVAAAVTGLALAPVFAPGVPPGLTAYAVSWEFNGPLYEPLWRGLDAAAVPEAVAGGLDAIKRISGRHALWNRFYPWIYAQFLAKGLLAGLAGIVVWRSLRRRDVLEATGALFGGLLLCVATLYPWYLLWVLPWAALAKHRGWLWVAGAALLSYWPQFAAVELWPWVYAAIWLPAAGLVGWEVRRGRSSWCLN